MRPLALALALLLPACGGDTRDHARCLLSGGEWECGPVGPTADDRGCWCDRPAPAPQSGER